MQMKPCVALTLAHRLSDVTDDSWAHNVVSELSCLFRYFTLLLSEFAALYWIYLSRIRSAFIIMPMAT